MTTVLGFRAVEGTEPGPEGDAPPIENAKAKNN